ATWEIVARNTYTLDADGYVIMDLHEVRSGSSWENQYRATYAYDARHNTTLDLQEKWDGTQWVGIDQTTFTFDANDNATLRLAKIWQSTQWVNRSRTTSTYTTGNFLASSSYEEWNTNAWIKSPYAFYTYDWTNDRFEADGCEVSMYYSKTLTDVNQHAAVVSTFALLQNYPNPFNPGTTIAYSIPERSHVLLKIYDVLGRNVATLVNDTENAGSHTVRLDASHLPSGVYIARLQSAGFVKAIEMILMK
ncbi:MAG TPA: T9SS type A sorting domain-containing protein, partial [Bacteroidota bacterium]|nr:T9SS type A sorting domain-containing protein [Bacteroidota bacterium]